MANTKHQAAWRAKVQKSRVEIYLDPEELAKLDGLGGTRAEAIRGLLVGKCALPENKREALPEIPDAVAMKLREAFPGPDGVGIDWTKAAEAALLSHRRREQEAKRLRMKRAAAKMGG
ncbi:hypothetical protein SAMN02949497_3237 [Methylomagnum ishizawai]|uniref:Uncharacterized protein n=1 Tax=Methylomagnum ishizawai TaxID=1760988 RepID=A0A1Y6CZU2_9GAMM|nr:hypothetical protein [Methylomagnum ishizawai]SMF95861.1 hypothetical protein SAMN02949497_3237 [Methylomagnum ishizawai]